MRRAGHAVESKAVVRIEVAVSPPPLPGLRCGTRLARWCKEAMGKLTASLLVKFAAPPRLLLRAQRCCSRPGQGPTHTARKRHPASSHGPCCGLGPNPLPGVCVLISPDRYVCLSTTTPKTRVSTYSSSIDSSRRVLLAPCLAAQITRAPANRGLSKSCDAPSAPSN
jgi:hypothetical protein